VDCWRNGHDTFDEPLWHTPTLPCPDREQLLSWRQGRAPAPRDAVTPAVCSALTDAYSLSAMAQSFIMGAAAMALVWVWTSVGRARARASISLLFRRELPQLSRQLAPPPDGQGGRTRAEAGRAAAGNGPPPFSSVA
jgi:hypothetical protein